ncbi:MAG: PAS domain S-box protein [Methanobacteriota archaeon]|nr:MAG: PAS domain S-box protein [Euryarchaeota archaeon]
MLFVEADDDLAKAGIASLSSRGTAIVERAASAEEAVALLGRSSFDTVICDCRMPDMRGVELLDRARNMGVEVPFVMLVERGETQMAAAAFTGDASFVTCDGADEQTRFAALLPMIEDSIGRSRDTSAMIESRGEFEQIVNASPVVVFMLEADPLWSVAFVSKNITQFGYTPDEFMSGKLTFADVIHPEDMLRLEEGVSEYVSKGERFFDLEGRVLTKWGELRWVDSRVFVRRDAEGKVQGYQGIVVDITERVRYKDAIERLALIVDSTQDAIISEDLEGTILTWNPAAEALYGYFAEEAVGESISMIIPPEKREEYFALFKQVRLGKTVPRFETVRTRKDGTEVSVSLTISPIRDRTGKIVGASAIARDITEAKKSEEALKQANEKLTLLGSITRHDVINQIGILTGYLSLLKDEVDEATRAKYIESARQSCRTIAEQLQFAGSYQKTGTKAPEWIRVRLELLGAMSSMDMGSVEVRESLGNLELFVDTMFEKVFPNLLMNSRRHGESVTWVEVGYRETGDELVLAYSDDGVGIPPEDKQRIFEKGYGKDSGLGLFLVREVLGMTGIDIREVGTQGSGTIFEMTVPPGKFRFAP